MKKYSVKLKYLMMAKEKKDKEEFKKKLCKEYPDITTNAANKIFEAFMDEKYEI